MPRLALALATLLAAFTAVLSAGEGKAEIRRAADTFGQALVAEQAGSLRRVLPETGKVELSLTRFGPEEGHFAPPQVEALFRDFLGTGSIRSFEVQEVKGDCRAHGVVQARVALIDRRGSPARVGLHLAFQLEGGRWVLRGIRETQE